jgi:hypothetical protein
MDPDARAYRRLIRRLADGAMNQRVRNGQPAHAAILLETMFRKAKADVRIYTGELSLPTYAEPDMIEEASAFLKRDDTCLRILLATPANQAWVQNHPFFAPILRNGQLPENMEVRCATGVYATPTAKHFAVMDDRAFRFERDHSGTKAIANFNEPGTAAKLIEAFDHEFGRARPIDAPSP